MPSYLPMRQIRSMSYSDLERWWEVDFDVLASTAVAEATGPVQPSVSEALQSDDWIEQWADALYAAAGELMSSTERMEWLNDPRFPTTQKRSGRVAQRMQQVNTMLRARTREQGWAMYGDHLKDARKASISILVRHHIDESRKLAQDEIARRGLAPRHPFWDSHYETTFDAIEDSVRRGIIQAPVTPEVTALLVMPAHALTHRAAADVTRQEDRCAELRHPLLLRGWTDALEHLRDRHCELAGVVSSFSLTLPSLNMREMRAMDTDDARTIINRRRFIRALAQRNRECQMHVRELSRTVAVRQDEIRQPWNDAVSASCEELVSRYPDQLEALLSAFRPYCVPGSTKIRRELLGTRRVVSHEVIPALKKALADGTWRRLLGPAA